VAPTLRRDVPCSNRIILAITHRRVILHGIAFAIMAVSVINLLTADDLASGPAWQQSLQEVDAAMERAPGYEDSAGSMTSQHAPPDEEIASSASRDLPSSEVSHPTVSSSDGWWTPFVDSVARTFVPHPVAAVPAIGPNGTLLNWLQTNASGYHQWCTGHGMETQDLMILKHLRDPNDPAWRPAGKKKYEATELPLTGILYVKSHKASSSTCEGVNERIAHQVAKRQLRPMLRKLLLSSSSSSSVTSRVCPHHNRHEFANAKQHGVDRKPAPESLLWTMVRYPPNRDLSHIFHFRVSRHLEEPTDEFIIAQLKTHVVGLGRQVRYLLPEKSSETQVSVQMTKNHPEQVATIVQRKILNHYDFIGVVERLTESLAVMTLLWDLEPGDVVVLNSKRSGGYDDGGGKNKNHKCTLIRPAFRSPGVRAYLDSDEYRGNHADFLLYHAVEASLNRTIESLGSERVKQRTEEIRWWQRLIDSECGDKAIFPCSLNGTFQPGAADKDCYIQDTGCGYRCMDRVVDEHHDEFVRMYRSS